MRSRRHMYISVSRPRHSAGKPFETRVRKADTSAVNSRLHERVRSGKLHERLHAPALPKCRGYIIRALTNRLISRAMETRGKALQSRVSGASDRTQRPQRGETAWNIMNDLTKHYLASDTSVWYSQGFSSYHRSSSRWYSMVSRPRSACICSGGVFLSKCI